MILMKNLILILIFAAVGLNTMATTSKTGNYLSPYIFALNSLM